MPSPAVFLSPLFEGLSSAEIGALLPLVSAGEKRYLKGETILAAGTTARYVCMVEEGSVAIESSDACDNTGVLARVMPGQVFAESYALLPREPLLVTAAAAENALILFLSPDRLLSPPLGVPAPSGYARLQRNLLQAFAKKSLHLSRRMLHTSPKTIRGRITSYLGSIALEQGGPTLTIPFDRRELADYLNVDRSALSAELGKMQREGLIKTRKNHFRLRPPEERQG